MYKVKFKLFPINILNLVSESSSSYKLISDLANEEGNFPKLILHPGWPGRTFF